MNNLKFNLGGLIAGILFLGSSVALAFPINATLTGDPRLDNPDGIQLDVTIDSISDTELVWNVSLAAMAGTDHDSAFLDEFYFNLFGISDTDVQFSAFDPTSWTVVSDPSVQGGGTFAFNFDFGAEDTANGPTGNVTTTQDLTFTMTYIGAVESFVWDTSNFLDAQQSCSSDETLGCGQLGAHVQSLGADGQDSGFALGSYGTNEVPVPATALLFGLGLAGFGLRRRRN